MIWSKLLETYENCNDIVRVAHVALPISVGVLLDPQGKLLLIQKFEKKEWAESPCTVKSETRTSNICPHILNDKYAYIGNKEKEKHEKYMDQLNEYALNSGHLYPNAIYRYLSENDIDKDLTENGIQADGSDYIGFAVYKMEYEPEEWTEYYTSSLPKNGVCTVTMQDDYIPESYPAKIMDATDKSKIFVKGCGVGYIASQKIIHAMQYLNWCKAAKN